MSQKQNLITRACPHCLQIFENIKSRVYANHVRWCPENKTNGDKGSSKISNSQKKQYNQKYGEYKDFKVKCAKCEKDFIVNERSKLYPKKDNYYCSRSCANYRPYKDRILSKESRKKISDSVKKMWQNNEYLKKQSNNRKYTSKVERIIREYFINKYPDDEWTFGGSILFEDQIIVRDLYSKKLQINFEFDGIWHFKDINGQLKKKKLKDKLLETWSIENDWRLIRISDWYYHNIDNPLNFIEDLIYHDNRKIIKYYSDDEMD
jgi:endogenous inhibitor of DNA gyrase (YacG/DUF329 family)